MPIRSTWTQVPRKVYFYRLHAGYADTGEDLPFDVRPALNRLSKLGFSVAGHGGRYMDNGDGNHTCGWVDANAAGRPTLRLATIRKTDLPQYETAGQLAPLNLPHGAGLAEATHMVFFPNSIVGAEFNFYGPRASRIREYLRHVAPVEAAGLEGIRPLIRASVLDQLKKLESLRMLSLRATPSYAAILAKEDSSLASILTAAAQVDGADQVTVTLSVAPHARKAKLGEKLLKSVLRLVRNKAIDEELVSLFRVSGFSPSLGRLDHVDLLGDFLVVETKVARVDDHTRAFRSDSVYEAIHQAHSELGEEINKALELS